MDVIDLAQRRQQEDIDHALAARVKAAGRTHCMRADCGAPISDLRREMGAVLCLDCQRSNEHRAQSCARRAI